MSLWLSADDNGLCHADLDAHQQKHTILNSVFQDDCVNNNMVEGWHVSSCEGFLDMLVKAWESVSMGSLKLVFKVFNRSLYVFHV